MRISYSGCCVGFLTANAAIPLLPNSGILGRWMTTPSSGSASPRTSGLVVLAVDASEEIGLVLRIFGETRGAALAAPALVIKSIAATTARHSERRAMMARLSTLLPPDLVMPQRFPFGAY